ncbi:DUF4157 domain-containing protein [Mucilaginibacter sp. AW1-3]
MKNTTERAQKSSAIAIANQSKGGNGISMPAVPVLQHKSESESSEPVEAVSVLYSPKEHTTATPFQPSPVSVTDTRSSQSAYPVQRKTNETGMPDTLKNGVETLSGFSMDDVKVHYNSPLPAQMKALAFAQGSNIHIGPGQERHLPHEAWHVAQQKQGRVQPTMQMKAGIMVNDDTSLEQEADSMGVKAIQMKTSAESSVKSLQQRSIPADSPIQRLVGFEIETRSVLTPGEGETALQKDKVLLTGTGWTLTVEVSALGKVVEFKVRAIDDQSDPATLKASLDSLTAFAEILGANASTPVTIEKLATDSGATIADNKFKKTTVTPEGATIIGQPQMTAGIGLDKIFSLLEDMSKEGSQLMRGPDKVAETKNYRDKMSNTLTTFDLFADFEKFSKTYKGFIALLSNYIHGTTTAGRLSYFKGAVPGLSRADLGLFMKIPEIAKQKGQILKDVLFYADVKGGDKMIPGGTYNDRKEEVDVELTIEQWVNSIITGVDCIPWSLQVNQESKAFDMEPVGAPDKDDVKAKGVPIEIRSLQSNIPHELWTGYLLHLFKYVQVLNSNNPAAYKQYKK